MIWKKVSISFYFFERKFLYHPIFSSRIGKFDKILTYDIEIFDQISPHTNLYDEIFDFFMFKVEIHNPNASDLIK